eukprot:TRINITY_DN8288_c1_g2_i1.p1 TRINITY_DN8288_c1_g2~~TRINITY_DN8288_c1_g2_i1.p1  ORF type:complete len:911 (-),score=171.44 TRINITY_DN8288_c1_g2_i1:174-2906(-)
MMLQAMTPGKCGMTDSQQSRTPAKRDMAKELAEWKAAKQAKAGKENRAQQSVPATPAQTPSRGDRDNCERGPSEKAKERAKELAEWRATKLVKAGKETRAQESLPSTPAPTPRSPIRCIHGGASPLIERRQPQESSTHQNSQSVRGGSPPLVERRQLREISTQQSSRSVHGRTSPMREGRQLQETSAQQNSQCVRGSASPLRERRQLQDTFIQQNSRSVNGRASPPRERRERTQLQDTCTQQNSRSLPCRSDPSPCRERGRTQLQDTCTQQNSRSLPCRSDPSPCRERSDARSCSSALVTEMRLPSSSAEETLEALPKAPPPSPESQRHSDQLARWHSMPHSLSPRRALAVGVTAAFPEELCTQELCPCTPATSSSAPVEVAGALSESMVHASEPVKTYEATHAVPSVASAVACGRVVAASSSVPLCTSALPQDQAHAPASACSVSVQQRLLERLEAVQDIKDVSDELRLKLAKARLQADRQEEPADAVPVEGRAELVSSDKGAGEQQEQRSGQQCTAMASVDVGHEEAKNKDAHLEPRMQESELGSDRDVLEVKGKVSSATEQGREPCEKKDDGDEDDVRTAKGEVTQEKRMNNTEEYEEEGVEQIGMQDEHIEKDRSELSTNLNEDCIDQELQDESPSSDQALSSADCEELQHEPRAETADSSDQGHSGADCEERQDEPRAEAADSSEQVHDSADCEALQGEPRAEAADSSEQVHSSADCEELQGPSTADCKEELRLRQQQVLETMVELQIEQGQIMSAPLAQRAALERDLKTRWEATLAERQELSRLESTLDADAWRQRVRSHSIKWTPLSTLDMDDHLSRAFDIYEFWFFESRDRVSNKLPKFEPTKLPDRIPEFPPNWPQWRIDSARLRDEASWRRRKSGGGARQLMRSEDGMPEVSTPESVESP